MYMLIIGGGGGGGGGGSRNSRIKTPRGGAATNGC
jgi:hypothetical protein